MSFFRTLLVLTSLACATLLRAGPVDDARSALVAGIEDVSTQLRGKPAQADLIALLDQVADKYFSFETTTRLAIGPAWRDFTPDQRARATRLFSRLVARTYAERLRSDSPPDISYGAPVELRPGRVETPTTVRLNGQTYSVIYRLELDPAAGWRVYDVIAEGVSLISNYRAQFDPIVKKSGADGLIAAIEAKVAEAAAAPAS